MHSCLPADYTLELTSSSVQTIATPNGKRIVIPTFSSGKQWSAHVPASALAMFSKPISPLAATSPLLKVPLKSPTKAAAPNAASTATAAHASIAAQFLEEQPREKIQFSGRVWKKGFLWNERFMRLSSLEPASLPATTTLKGGYLFRQTGLDGMRLTLPLTTTGAELLLWENEASMTANPLRGKHSWRVYGVSCPALSQKLASGVQEHGFEFIVRYVDAGTAAKSTLLEARLAVDTAHDLTLWMQQFGSVMSRAGFQ